MTVPLLLEHFDELISTPDDVEKLKRSILQLAMQGKLVEQNPNDESTKNLLKRISKIKAEAGNKQAIMPVSESDKPYDLPEGWEWTHLGDICQIVGGGTPRTNIPENFADEGIPWVTPADLYRIQSKTISRGRRDISEKGLANSSARLIPAGSVLFSSRAPIGYVAIAANEISTNQGFKSCVPFLMELNQYIYYFLKFSASEIDSRASGTTFKEVSGREMQKVLVPLPPLAEQERIVARVEELFAQTRRLAEELSHSRRELDRLNESALSRLLASETPEEFNERWGFIAEHLDLLTSAPEHIAPLRQSILELAVRGKLTRRETGDEPASIVIQTIRKENKTKLAPVSKDEAPYELPDGWEWIRFGEVGDQRLGKMLDKNKNKGDYYPYLRNINVQWLRIDLSDVNQMRYEPNEVDEYKLQPNDLLICEGGEPGRCAIWQGTDLMFFQKAIHRVRPYHGIVSKYLLYHLWADAGNGILEKYFTGATIKHLTGKALAQYICALPPVAEQERIVKRVEQLLGWCDALEAQLRSAEEERGRLVESVLVGVGVGGSKNRE